MLRPLKFILGAGLVIMVSITATAASMEESYRIASIERYKAAAKDLHEKTDFLLDFKDECTELCISIDAAVLKALTDVEVYEKASSSNKVTVDGRDVERPSALTTASINEEKLVTENAENVYLAGKSLDLVCDAYYEAVAEMRRENMPSGGSKVGTRAVDNFKVAQEAVLKQAKNVGEKLAALRELVPEGREQFRSSRRRKLIERRYR